MKTSQKGIDLIKSFEGLHLTAYKDTAGVLTIGYGHTKGLSEGMKITKDQAEAYLLEDLKAAESAVIKKPYEWNQNEFDALVSFTFNCGSGNLTKLVKSGKRTKEEISDALLLYNKAGGKELAGLARRRQAEKDLFDTPICTEVYPAYTGEPAHLDTILKSVGVPAAYIGSYKKRRPLAEANGIAGYQGTARQNLDLIALARAGKLVKV